MVTKVAAPLEYALLSQSQSIVADFAKRGLHEMAVSKLLEHKLATKNFKAGISFDTSSELKHGFRKLVRLAKNQIIKELTWIETSFNPNSWLVEGFSAASPSNIYLVHDQAVVRYVRMLTRQLRQAEIPLHLGVTAQSREEINDTMVIQLNLPVNTNQMREMYRLFMHIPQMVKALKTLSRKANFRNETYRTINRYRSPVGNAVRHA